MRYTFLSMVSLSACILTLGVLPAMGQSAASTNNDAVTTSDINRAKAIVQKMTLPEKIEELHGEGTRQYGRHIVGIPRLGIPELRLANGCVGVGPADDSPQKRATALPAEIALAATWDPILARQYGEVIGREARDLNYGMVEGPDINIARVPQNGRTFEGYGEDPYLTSHIVIAVVHGIQSQDVIAEVKHYDANNQEMDRFGINEIVPLRALHEIYFPAFKAAVEQGDVGAVMGAYPKVNGVFCCENHYLQQEMLENQWHFAGYITSDFGATHSTVASALNGLDVEMPKGHYFADPLEAAVKAGKVPMSVIDAKLVRRFATMMRFHLFTHPPVEQPIPEKRDGLIARKTAEQSMVLLKNQGHLLPLNVLTCRSIVVIGPDAQKAMTGGGGSSHVEPLYMVNPVQGLSDRAGAKVKVSFSNGRNIKRAVALAKKSQIAIVMVGDHETEGRDDSLLLTDKQNELVQAVATANPHTIVVLKTGSSKLLPWVDHVPAILEAWYPGEEDGNAVAAVLFGDVNPSGKLPLTFMATADQVPAHTTSQYPGVPVAKAKPAAAHHGHQHHHGHHGHGKPLVVHYSEGILVGYRYYDAKHLKPLYPFGYGLSYTSFAFHHLHIDQPAPAAGSDASLQVTCDLTNTGKTAGADVAQLYLGYPSSAQVPEPPEQLRGFAKVFLQSGQTQQVTFTVPINSLSYWSLSKMRWQPLPGNYRILVGDSSRNLPLQGALNLTQAELPIK